MSENKGSAIGYLVEEIGLKNTIELIDLHIINEVCVELKLTHITLNNWLKTQKA